MSYAVATLIGVSSTLLVLITVFIVIRFFVRSVLLRSIDWDDGNEFNRLTDVFARALADVVVTDVGFGSHMDVVSTDDLHEFLKASGPLQTVTMLSYIWGFVTVKMSFAVLYVRLLPGIVPRRINQGLLVLLLAEGIEECLVVIFRCNPVDKAWTPLKEGTCLDLRSFYYASFGVKLATDIILFAQPIPVVWRLQLSTAKRIGVVLMLSLGLFVCVISIIRVTYISIIKGDITYALVDPMLWSEVEVCALILCACIPSFRPFLRCFPSVNKALGLSSGRESDTPYHRDVSLGRPSIISTGRSDKHKQSRGGIYESPDLEITGAATPSEPLRDHGSTEEILSHEPDERSETFVTGSLQPRK
ncbi:hypothetical protein B0J13DRAFT_514966 [Dactylonectria estremocensis]|uniref:Rhodopsin domain-containing protein n=1 Tax=Dactylonectria estremocensis TaxID=1079267 RepID=A0A9P9D8V6_9HYPO|nr:hypothetical protein B0J13DRAFT_514966 [Dactylonectria estremocensis]